MKKKGSKANSPARAKTPIKTKSADKAGSVVKARVSAKAKPVAQAPGGRIKFDYFKPDSTKEALKLLGQYKGKAAFLAGGTDLIVKIRVGKLRVDAVIDIKGLEDLSEVRKTKTQVMIGPLTTIAEIAKNQVIKENLPILSRTALLMASPQVRNRGTIGGNICNASPSADMVPPLIALGTKVEFLRGRDIYTAKLEDFFEGPGETVLKNKGLLSAIAVPIPKSQTKVAYQVLTLREAMDLSIVSAAAMVYTERGIIKKAKIVLGAVAPVPLLAAKAAKVLVGTRGKAKSVVEAAAVAASECAPISDVRASQEYRREMVAVVTRRVLEEMLG